MTLYWPELNSAGTKKAEIGAAYMRARTRLRSSAATISAPPDKPKYVRRSRKLAFDALETRILLSADISPYIDAIDDGLDRLDLLAENLGAFEELSQPIPVLGASLSEATNFAQTIRDELLAPIRGVIDDIQNGTSTLLPGGVEAAELGDAFDTAVNLGGGVVDFTGVEAGGIATFTGAFSISDMFEDRLIDLGAEAENLGLAVNGTFDFATILEFNVGFGVVLDPLLSPSESFFIDDTSSLSVSGSADLAGAVDSLDLGLLGDAGVDISGGGAFEVAAALNVALTDPDIGTAGRITGEDIDNSTIGDLVDVTVDAASALDASFAVTAPDAASAITGLMGEVGTVDVQVQGDFFGDFEIDVDISADLLDFGRVTPSLLLSFVGDLGAKLTSLSQVFTEIAQVDFLDVNVGDLANFSDTARELIAGLSLPGLVGVSDIDLGVLTDDITFDVEITDSLGAETVQAVSVLQADIGAGDPLGDLITEINADLTGVVAEIRQGQLVLTGTDTDIVDLRLGAVNAAASAALGLQTDQAGAPLPTFSSIQEFAVAVEALPIFDALPVGLAYDPATSSLTFTLDLLDESLNESVSLAFSQALELGPLELALTGSAEAFIDATVDLAIGVGLELGGIAGGTLLADLNGGAGIDFSLNGGADLLFATADGRLFEFTFGASDTTAREFADAAALDADTPTETRVVAGGVATVADLIEAVRQGSGGDTGDVADDGAIAMAIDALGNGFALSDNTTGVNGFAVSGGGLSNAVFDLGFGFGAVLQDGFDAITGGLARERFFIDEANTDIGLSVEVTAPDIELFGALGFVTFGVMGGQLGGTLTPDEAAGSGLADVDPDTAGVQIAPLGFVLELPLADVFNAADGRIFLSELSQQAPGAPIALDNTGFTPAGTSDLLIELHNGDMFEVDLDGVTDIDGAIAAIEAASQTGGAGTERVDVFLNGVGNGLIVQDLTTDLNSAVGSLTLTGQPVDGDTVTVGLNIFEFDDNGSVDAGRISVTIGADVAATGASLASAIDALGDVNAAGSGDATAFTVDVTLQNTGDIDPELRQSLSTFGDVWVTRTFNIEGASGSTAAEQLGLEGLKADTDGDGFVRGDALAGAEFAVLADLDPESLLDNGLTISAGQMLLPIVLEGGSGFGIEDQTFYLVLGFTEGSIAIDVDLADFDFDDLFTSLGNFQAPDLFSLVGQIGSLLGDQFDLLDFDLPLLDVSLSDIADFVGDQLNDITSTFTDAFTGFSDNGLVDTAPEAIDRLLALLDDATGVFTDAEIAQIVSADAGAAFLNALQSLKGAIDTTLGSFDFFLSGTPAEVLSTFAALQSSYRNLLDEFGPGALKDKIVAEIGGAINTIENAVPSTETLLRILHQALGFDLPDIEDVLPTLNAVNDAIADIVAAANTAIADLQMVLDGLDPAPGNLADINTFIANLTTILDSISGAATNDISDRLGELITQVEDGVADIFDLVDLLPDVLSKVDDLTALLDGVDFATLLADIAEGARDDFIAAVSALVTDYFEQVRDAVFGQIFSFGVLDFDINPTDGVFSLGLMVAPKLVDLNASGLSFSFDLGGLPVGADVELDQLTFEVGGVIEIGLAIEYSVTPEEFDSDFAVFVDTDSEFALTTLLLVEGEVVLQFGAVGVQLGDLPGDPARIALTDFTGEAPAFIGVGVVDTPSGLVAIGDVAFEIDLEAQLVAEALFFDLNGDPILTALDPDGVFDDAQVEIGLNATVDNDFNFTFAGDGIDGDEVDAILNSLIAFDLSTLVDAIDTFLVIVEETFGADALGAIPVIGDDFVGFSDLVADFREGTFADIRNFLSAIDAALDPADVIDQIQGVIFSAFAGAPLGLALFEDDGMGGLVEIDDADDILVSFTGVDPTDLAATEVIIEPLQIGFNIDETFAFDFGLDAFVFEFVGDGAVEVFFDTVFTLGFGASLTEGAFLVLPDDGSGGLGDIFEATLGVSVDEASSLFFELFFLGVEATPWEDAVAGGAGVGFDATVDLGLTGVPLGNTTATGFKLGLSDLGGVGFDLDIAAQLDIDLEIRAGLAADATGSGGASVDSNLPSLTTFLDIDWEWSLDDPNGGDLFAAFYDLSLDFGEFLAGPLGEIVDSIQTFTAPLQPFLDFLDLEIPIISQLSELFGQGEITFVDAIRLLGSGAESVEVLLDILDTVDTIVDAISAFDTSGGLVFNFGDLILSDTAGTMGDDPCIDLRDINQRSALADTMSIAGMTTGDSVDSDLAGSGFLANVLDDLREIGVELPVLDNPSLLFGLLFGQRVDLVTYDVPRLEAEFGVSYRFGPLLPPVPLFVTVGGGFEIFLDLALGYDTRGLETGDFFDGFYFADYNDAGEDILELGLGVFFEATASLSVVVAEAGVTGGVEAEIGANWNDVEEDGKFYLDELGLRAQQSILCIFDLEGALEAFLEAFVRLGFDTPFGFVTLFEDSFELLRVTLLDFSLSCPPLPPPEPATALDDGTGSGDFAVRLNIGEFAEFRQSGAEDGEDTIEIFGERDDLTAVAQNVSIWDGGVDSDFFSGDNKLTATEVAENLAAGGAVFNRDLDLNSDNRIDTDEILAVTDLAGDAGALSDDWILVIGYGEWEIFRDVSKIYAEAGAEDDTVFLDPTSVLVRAEIDGGAGDDELTLGAGDDVVAGGGGVDIILGFDGDDNLIGDGGLTVSATSNATTSTGEAGSDGADQIFGGGGADTVDAGGGDDVVRGNGDDDAVSDGGDRLLGGTGNDDIVGDDGNDFIDGEGGSDNLSGDAGDDTIEGGAEIDLIQGGLGADSILGEAGNDIIYGETTDFFELPFGVSAATLGDTIRGGTGDDEIRGQFGDDSILGGDDNDRLIGGLGDDSIFGEGGVDDIRGDRLPDDGFDDNGAGNDSIEGGADGDRIFAGGGDDSVIGGASDASVLDGADFITGQGGDDLILGDNGRITSSTDYQTFSNAGTGGADTLRGDGGSDVVAGGNFSDQVFGDNTGGAGQDLMAGDQIFRDGVTILSSSGPEDAFDLMFGFGGDDLIFGGGGGDIILSGLGDDLMVGDYGLVVLKSGGGATLFDSIRFVETTQTDLGGDDRLIADQGDDIVLGGFGADVISGGGSTDGDDILLGDNGRVVRDDPLDGGDRNDIFSTAPSDAGADTITGGVGDDVIIGGGDEDELSGQAGADVILGDYGDVLRDNATSPNLETAFSTFTDTGADDDIFGGADADIVLGGLGDDIIEGADGDDILVGDNGEVIYNGADGDITTADEVRTTSPADGGGDDAILGQAGADIVIGGLGADQIYGDLDADITRGSIIVENFTGVAGGGDDILVGDNGELLQSDGAPIFLTSTETDAGGRDLIEGHDGDDVIIGGFESDVLHGDAPAATIGLLTATGHDVILGDSGEVDWIFGADTLQATIDRVRTIDAANGADDVILGNDGRDIAFGGAGDDTLLGDQSANVATATLTISGRLGAADGDADVLVGDAGQLVRLNDLSDFLTVTDVAIGGDDLIEGHEAGDILIGGAGRDIVHGEAATATQSLVAFGGGDVMLGDSGEVDWSNGDADPTTVDRVESIATAIGGDDILLGDSLNDIAFGGAGDDIVLGDFAGNVSAVFDGDGVSAVYTVTDYAAPVSGGGLDVLLGDSGQLLQVGGAPVFLTSIDPGVGGRDRIEGHDFDDAAIGGADDDLIFGEAPQATRGQIGTSGNDALLGDSGLIDWVGPVSDGDQTTIDLVQSIAAGMGGDDLIFGNDGADIAFGGAANDEIYGDFYADASLGGAPSNFASAGSGGGDLLLGDSGLLTQNAGDPISLESTDFGIGGQDTIEGDDLGDVIIGGADADIGHGETDQAKQGLINAPSPGEDADDVIFGDSGEVLWTGVDADQATIDVIRSLAEGVGGDDAILGNDDSDILIGGAFDDLVLGDFYADLTFVNAANAAGDRARAFGAENHSAANTAGAELIFGDSGEILFDLGAPTSMTSTGLDIGGDDLIEGHGLGDIAIGGTGEDEIHGDAPQATRGLLDALVGDRSTGEIRDDILMGDEGLVDWIVRDGSTAEIDLISTINEQGGADLIGGRDAIFGNDDRDIMLGGGQEDLILGDVYGDATLVAGAFVLDPLNAGNREARDTALGDQGFIDFAPELGDATDYAIAGRPDLAGGFSGEIVPLLTADTIVIRTTDPTNGAGDLILGNGAADLLLGGAGADRIGGDNGLDEASENAQDGDDVIFGDHGLAIRADGQGDDAAIAGDNWYAVDTGALDGGLGDLISAGGGDDRAQGQQGDDVMFGGTGEDDLIGGHNSEGGQDDLDGLNTVQVDAITGALADLDPTDLQEVNDIIDGGAGEDVILGDNGVIERVGVADSPRHRELIGDELYTMTGDDITVDGVDYMLDLGFTPNVGDAVANPDADLARRVYLFDFDAATEQAAADNPALSRPFGDDVIAGGSEDDEIWGGLGDDVVQGDGSIDIVPASDADIPFNPSVFVSPTFTVPGRLIDSDPLVPIPPQTAIAEELVFSVFEGAGDGDDYIEGNGGNDRIYGNLGQDDLIGGSSNLYAVNFPDGTDPGAEGRPDGADLIYGGAGALDDLARNSFGDGDHVSDADYILGDNGNLFHILDGGQDAQFDYAIEGGYGGLEVRAFELLDYEYILHEDTDASDGIDHKVSFNDFGTGAGDLIHGESGDDVIHGMTGDDALFGESGDDDIYGEAGADYILAGTGQDGVLGDDGLLRTSRNIANLGEDLWGVEALRNNDIDKLIRTPGNLQLAIINRDGELNKEVDLVAFDLDGVNFAIDGVDASGVGSQMTSANDIIFGGLGLEEAGEGFEGLGGDWIHGGFGDDAVSGAEALSDYYDGGADGFGDVNDFLKAQQDNGDLDAAPAAAEDPFWIEFAPYNPGDILRFGADDDEEFDLYDEDDPRRLIEVTENVNGVNVTREFLLNFDAFDVGAAIDDRFELTDPDLPQALTDGDDNLFGDLGNDWIVGGTGRDHFFGGRGFDLLNMDDDHVGASDDPADPKANDAPDPYQQYADIAYDGAGRDVLILNTGADRAIAWVGEYNTYLVPFSPFGAFHVSRSLQPQTEEFVLDLAEASGADQTTPDILRYGEQFAIDDKIDPPDPDRNFEPFGELGMVRQEDVDWQDQTGSPDDPQAGNDPGQRDIMRRELFMADAPRGNSMHNQLGELAAAEADFVDAALANPDATLDEILSDHTLGVFDPGLINDAFAPLDVGDTSGMTALTIGADVMVEQHRAGSSSEIEIIFDRDGDAYKFARFDVQTNRVEIGEVGGDGSELIDRINYRMSSETNYRISVAIDGGGVSVSIDGVHLASHDFGESLTEGMIGVAAFNSAATFSNVVVEGDQPVLSAPDPDATVVWDEVVVEEGAAAGGDETASAGDAPSTENDEDEAVIVVESWLPRSDFEASMSA